MDADAGGSEIEVVREKFPSTLPAYELGFDSPSEYNSGVDGEASVELRSERLDIGLSLVLLYFGSGTARDRVSLGQALGHYRNILFNIPSASINKYRPVGGLRWWRAEKYNGKLKLAEYYSHNVHGH